MPRFGLDGVNPRRCIEGQPATDKSFYKAGRVFTAAVVTSNADGPPPAECRAQAAAFMAEAVFALNLVSELDRLLGTSMLKGVRTEADPILMAKVLAEGFHREAARNLAKELAGLVVTAPPVWHRPRLTSADDPAHGCEACDGDDYCTCPGKEARATCLGCGGKWPDCDPNYKV